MSPRRPTPFARWALLLYLVVCAAALMWPGLALVGERAPALVLGAPFALVWSTAWILATFGVMALFHRAAGD